MVTTIKHGKEKVHSEQLQNVDCTAAPNRENQESYNRAHETKTTTDTSDLRTLWWLLAPCFRHTRGQQNNFQQK